MSDIVFVATLFFYLLSVVCCLLLFLFSKNIPNTFTKSLMIVHFIGAIGYFVSRLSMDQPPTWLSIVFWCSGILLAGDVFRKAYAKWIKAYFLLFLITIPLFIFIPSRIILLVAGKAFGKPGEGRYRVVENYFLVRTSEPIDSMGLYRSKFIKEMGFFHKTIARGIPTPAVVDSIATIGPFTKDQIGSIVLYSGNTIDTIQTIQYRISPKRNQITTKP